jgi:hypothetical protein
VQALNIEIFFLLLGGKGGAGLLERYYLTLSMGFQSHHHILQELHEFLTIMSAITMFRKSSFHI